MKTIPQKAFKIADVQPIQEILYYICENNLTIYRKNFLRITKISNKLISDYDSSARLFIFFSTKW